VLELLELQSSLSSGIRSVMEFVELWSSLSSGISSVPEFREFQNLLSSGNSVPELLECGNCLRHGVPEFVEFW
jgi:hypothetical protein